MGNLHLDSSEWEKSLNHDYTLILIIPLENDLKKTITTISDFVAK